MRGLSPSAAKRLAAAVMVAVVAVWLAMPAGACESFETDDRTTHRRLTLEDFQGRPPRYAQLSEDGGLVIHKARIRLRMEILDLGVHVIGTAREMTATVAAPCVMAVMFKNGSGANASRMSANDLLHEQLHFDIAHHFSGVLRERLKGVEFTAGSVERLRLGVHARVVEVLEAVLAEERATQERFDRETSRRGTGAALARWRRFASAPSRAGRAESTLASLP